MIYDKVHKTCSILVWGADPLTPPPLKGQGSQTILACFLCYLKISNTTFEKWCILEQIVWENQKLH